MDDATDDADGAPAGDPGDGELGALAVVLLVVGAAATIAGLTTLGPGWILIAGLVTFALGAAVPLWTFWRRRRAEDVAGR